MPAQAKGRKGKLGKNKHRIATYYASGRWAFNKLRRLNKHIEQHRDDTAALKAAKLLMAELPLSLSRQLRRT